MSTLEAIILGIIQGLTEFLPVSSSGHLELAKVIFGEDLSASEGLLFTIVLHAATALSTLVIFRKEVGDIFKGLFQFKWNKETQYALKIVISMIPAGLVGFLLESEINEFFNGNVVLVGSMLILTGLLLFVADKSKHTNTEVGFVKALVIGISQAIAILPGISRSGATISTSVILGVDRTKAARFSFLMVVPLILGAMTLKIKDYSEMNSFNELNASQRTETIIQGVHEQRFLNESEKAELTHIILGKERAWDKVKNQDSNVVEESSGLIEPGITQLEDNFNQVLIDSGLDSELTELVKEDDFAKVRPIAKTSFLHLLMGFIAAFITGLFACNWMISLVKRSKLVYFTIYCVIVGVSAIAWGLFQ